jgi:hypothetical protein
VDFVRRWSEKTEISAGRFIRWLDITASKFYGWRERYGRAFWCLQPSICDSLSTHRMTFVDIEASLFGYSRAVVNNCPSIGPRLVADARLFCTWGTPNIQRCQLRFALPTRSDFDY